MIYGWIGGGQISHASFVYDGFVNMFVHAYTALASIVGYHELTKTSQILTNATFRPFVIYGLLALIYFAMCYPLTAYSRSLERKLGKSLAR